MNSSGTSYSKAGVAIDPSWNFVWLNHWGILSAPVCGTASGSKSAAWRSDLSFAVPAEATGHGLFGNKSSIHPRIRWEDPQNTSNYWLNKKNMISGKDFPNQSSLAQRSLAGFFYFNFHWGGKALERAGRDRAGTGIDRSTCATELSKRFHLRAHKYTHTWCSIDIWCWWSIQMCNDLQKHKEIFKEVKSICMYLHVYAIHMQWSVQMIMHSLVRCVQQWGLLWISADPEDLWSHLKEPYYVILHIGFI